MLVYKNQCGPNAKPDRASAKPGKSKAKPGKPHASRWNVGCVGSLGVGSSHGACTFHVCVNFICVGYPRQTPFWVEYRL